MDLTQEVDVGCPLPLLRSTSLSSFSMRRNNVSDLSLYFTTFNCREGGREGEREGGREGGRERKRERERRGEGEGEGGRKGEGEVDCQPHQLLVYAREMSSDHLYKT